MRFNSVYFGITDCAIGKSNSGRAFHLTPAALTVSALQVTLDGYPLAYCNRLGGGDFAEDIKCRHVLILATFLGNPLWGQRPWS